MAAISSHENYNFQSSQGWIPPAAFQQVLILHVTVSSQKFHFYEFLMTQSNFFKVTERPSSYSDIKFAHSSSAALQESEQGWCVVAVGGGKNDGGKQQKVKRKKQATNLTRN